MKFLWVPPLGAPTMFGRQDQTSVKSTVKLGHPQKPHQGLNLQDFENGK